MTPQEIQAALAEPFPPEEIQWLPQTVTKDGKRALACAYVDARTVEDRLDAVLGVGGWSDSYTVLDDGNVMCQLSLKIGGEWVVKTDVGGVSDQKDPGDRRKASFSDALKRAAVKAGISRYLYSLPAQWCAFDAEKKQFSVTPTLPPWALPKRPPQAKPASSPAVPAAQAKQPPANGAELLQRLLGKEATLAREGLCESGELVRHVLNAGTRAGWSNSMANWGEDAIKLAGPAVKAFEEERRARAARQAKALAELRERYDGVTPQGLADLERDVMAADIRQADRDELVRGIRGKADDAKGKGKRAKAG